MLPVLPVREAMFEAVRGVINVATLRYSPRIRSAARHATAILGANSTNARDCERGFGRHVEQLLETALPEAPEPDCRRCVCSGAANCVRARRCRCCCERWRS